MHVYTIYTCIYYPSKIRTKALESAKQKQFNQVSSEELR